VAKYFCHEVAILVGQVVAANEASLAMYRKGWSQPPEFFAARTKYLQLADKAARTVVLLTERLDHHRGRGQQQITVKHVTTNNVTADQAIITDSVTTGGARNVPVAPLIFANGDLRWDIQDLDAWINSLKAGAGNHDADAIIERLGA
jgi:hypothetical protein